MATEPLSASNKVRNTGIGMNRLGLRDIFEAKWFCEGYRRQDILIGSTTRRLRVLHLRGRHTNAGLNSIHNSAAVGQARATVDRTAMLLDQA